MSFSNNQSPDKVYYDITITNLESATTRPPPLYFTETRNIPFIYDPESYLLSVIRFQLDTPTLPIFTPQIQPYSPDINATVYSITLSYTEPTTLIEYNQQTYITFSPQDLEASHPPAPSTQPNGLQSNYTGYYYIYSYQYWINLVNKTFTDCFNALSAQVVAGGNTLPTTYAPLLQFDNQAQIAVLIADNAAYNPNLANPIQIYFNPPLYHLFSSFPAYIVSINGGNLGKNFLIQTYNFSGGSNAYFPAIDTEYVSLQIPQEYSTISLWNPVTSIVFCSNTLPIVSNQVSAPLLYNNGIVIQSGGNNANISQIITDFVADNYLSSIIYLPSAQYRYIEMFGNRPLYTVDIVVYWKDRYGALNPFLLSSGSSATIKFLFTKKESSNNSKSN